MANPEPMARTMLHITNGESVVHGFREVSLPGSYLAWNDVLHDGPVPHTQTLDELTGLRARAFSEFGWGDADAIRASLAARNRVLEDFQRHEEVILWFEHDLYDQLQLVQLLDWLAARDLDATRLSLIQINAFPGVEPFHGLGQLTGKQLTQLFPARRPVSSEQLARGREVWQAFRAADPTALAYQARRDLPELPFLRAALVRFLEEYPWVDDGLSRNQRQILRAAASGGQHRREIYEACQRQEQCPWGDASVYWRIAALAAAPAPALERISSEQYAINEHGRRLLDGAEDWIASSGGIDVWLGGVHLEGAQASWRWNDKEHRLEPVS